MVNMVISTISDGCSISKRHCFFRLISSFQVIRCKGRIVGFFGHPGVHTALRPVEAHPLANVPLRPTSREQRFILRFGMFCTRGQVGLWGFGEAHLRGYIRGREETTMYSLYCFLVAALDACNITYHRIVQCLAEEAFAEGFGPTGTQCDTAHNEASIVGQQGIVLDSMAHHCLIPPFILQANARGQQRSYLSDKSLLLCLRPVRRHGEI